MVETKASQIGPNVTDQFQSVLYTNVFLFAALIIGYSFLRYLFIDFEARRKYAQDPKSGITHPNLGWGYFTWLTYMITMSHTEFYYHCGIDALVLRMFLKSCIQICLWALPFSLIILIPIYGTAERGTTDALAAISLPNVADQSRRMWASAIGQWYLVCVTLYILSTLYLRLAFICDNYNCGNHFFNDFVHNITWRSFLKMDIAQDPNTIESSPSQHDAMIGINMPENDNNNGDTEDEKAKRAASKHSHKHKHKQNKEALAKEKWYTALAHLPIRSSRLTVMVSELPPHYRNIKLLWQMMDDLFPGQVLRVVLVPDVREITKLDEKVSKHQLKLDQMEKRYAKKDKHQEKPVKKRLHCCGCYGPKVDMAEHNQQEIAKYTAQIREKIPNLKITPYAFIQFTNLTAANFFLSVPLRFGVLECKTLPTPRPEDILWPQMAYSVNEIRVSRIIVYICMVLLLSFWTVPVTALQSLAHLREVFDKGGITLADYLPLAFIVWLEGFLSVFLLNGWLHLVPIIVDKLAERERWVTIGDHRVSCLVKYFDCLLFMLVFVTSISGTILQSLESTGWDAIEVIRLLGIGLSKMSTYFMMYLLNLALFQIPFQLFRIGYWVKRWLLGKDEHNFDYWSTYPVLMIGLLLCITYGAMSPLIWFVGLVFFGMMYLVLSYQLSMCFINYHECGLELWPAIFLRLVWGIQVGNVTLIALLALKRAIGPAVMVFLLAIAVYFFSRYLHKNYSDNFYRTDIRTARKFDVQQRVQDFHLAKRSKLFTEEMPVPDKPLPIIPGKEKEMLAKAEMREPSMSEKNAKDQKEHEPGESKEDHRNRDRQDKSENKADEDHEEKMAVDEAERSLSDDTRRMEQKKLLEAKGAQGNEAESPAETSSPRSDNNRARNTMEKQDQDGVDEKENGDAKIERSESSKQRENEKKYRLDRIEQIQPFKDREWDREYVPPVVKKYVDDPTDEELKQRQIK